MSYPSFQLGAAGTIGAAYVGFVVLMTNGFTLGQRTPGQMMFFIMSILAVCAVALAVLWLRSLQKDGKRSLPDEREEAIETAADRSAYRILDLSLYALLVVALTDAQWPWLGSFALVRPEGIVFALVTVSALAAIGRFTVGYFVARQR